MIAAFGIFLKLASKQKRWWLFLSWSYFLCCSEYVFNVPNELKLKDPAEEEDTHSIKLENPTNAEQNVGNLVANFTSLGPPEKESQQVILSSKTEGVFIFCVYMHDMLIKLFYPVL